MLGTPVCIKHASHISPQDEAILVEEAKAIWDLRHYAIPSVREILKLDDGSLALVMSYIPGPTLEQIMEKNGSLEAETVCWIVERVLNALRFEDEFVRHKILDVIGDLALIGHPIVGHLVAHRGGHALHTAFVAKVLEDTEAWRLVEGRIDPAAAEVPVAIPIDSVVRLAN